MKENKCWKHGDFHKKPDGTGGGVELICRCGLGGNGTK